jgi:hypothetical protein
MLEVAGMFETVDECVYSDPDALNPGPEEKKVRENFREPCFREKEIGSCICEHH